VLIAALLKPVSPVATLPRMASRLHEVLLDQFTDAFYCPLKKLVLDFGATDDPVFGDKEGRFFHGLYRRYCFSPLEDAVLVLPPRGRLRRLTGQE
jgi:hypothetical protein